MKKLIAVIVSCLLAATPYTVSAATIQERKISVSDIIESVKANCTDKEGDYCKPSMSCGASKIISCIINGNCGIPDINIPDIGENESAGALKDIISAIIDRITGGNTSKPDDSNKPDEDKPDIPDTDKPDEDKPDMPDTDIPDVKPEEPDKPGNDDTDSRPSENSSVNRVLELVNKYRNSNGLASVKLDSSLNKAADIRAKEIKSSFSHTRPNGGSCFTVLSELGISYGGAGENIAYGQSSPEEVMTAWMNSEGHRANILNPSFTKLGVGVYSSGETIYWAQMFTY